jgi:hypothetical protein
MLRAIRAIIFQLAHYPLEAQKPPFNALKSALIGIKCYCFLYQALSRYTKAYVELTDHPNGQGTLTGKNLVDAIAFTDHWLQVFRF